MCTNYMLLRTYKYATFRHILGFIKNPLRKILPIARSEEHDTNTANVMGSIPRECARMAVNVM